MRKIYFLGCLFCCGICFAQSQELKQLELDIQKLAQLKSMLSEMSRGYTILDKGFGAIKDLSSENYGLHKAYLDQLLDVSPSVKNNTKISSAIDQQKQIVAACQSSRQMIAQSSVITDNEKTAILALLQNIALKTSSMLEELQLIITPGVLRMNDAERMEGITRIEKSMKEKLAMVLQQQKNIGSLIALRQKQYLETQSLKTLY